MTKAQIQAQITKIENRILNGQVTEAVARPKIVALQAQLDASVSSSLVVECTVSKAVAESTTIGGFLLSQLPKGTYSCTITGPYQKKDAEAGDYSWGSKGDRGLLVACGNKGDKGTSSGFLYKIANEGAKSKLFSEAGGNITPITGVTFKLIVNSKDDLKVSL